eukprot:TRINITY_DN6734_c0_g1_i1.p1 TRINITY_DN6734_c0_g1~~TRINITY_DN6734_c0_g1_i1.p1  ORF type:complete len:410 (+),score=99.19 TRINITY_DN6734_c0_g1_i1:64-1293(+)
MVSVPFSKLHVGDDGIEGLKKYKYSGQDLSFVSYYILQPYWRWAVNLLPRTVAPNLVTLYGLGMIMASYYLVEYFSPDCRTEVPRWVWVIVGLCLFGYQTLDALDGKQARRTGTSSPLGELFDHGCDAVGTHLISLNTMSALMLPKEASYWAVFYVVLLSGGFYFCAWEQYHTGTLTLGYINGPVEGILLLVSIYFATAATGNTFWTTNEYNGTPYYLWLLSIACISGTFTLGGNIINVIRRNAGGGTTVPPIFTLLPVLYMAASIAALYIHHTDYVSGEGFRVVCLAFGMAVANSCGGFVISRVTNVLSSIMTGLIVPTIGFPVAAVVYTVVPSYLEPDAAVTLMSTLPVFMQCYLYVLSALYIHLVFSVCERISMACGINVLTMTPEQVKVARQMEEKEKEEAKKTA